MMESTAETGELAKALSQLHGLVQPVVKANVVAVTSSKGSYTYRYVTLAEVWEAVQPHLPAVGLAVSQLVGDGALETVLMHTSGQRLVTRTPLRGLTVTRHDGKGGTWKEEVGPQGYGSAVSYMRRYALAAILQIPQADDDGQEAEGIAAPRAAAPAPARAPTGQAPPRAAAVPATGPPGGGSIVLRFGSAKGTEVRQLADKDLAWYVRVVGEHVADPAKARYRKHNEELLAALTAERDRRARSAAPAAKPAAPPAPFAGIPPEQRAVELVTADHPLRPALEMLDRCREQSDLAVWLGQHRARMDEMRDTGEADLLGVLWHGYGRAKKRIGGGYATPAPAPSQAELLPEDPPNPDDDEEPF